MITKDVTLLRFYESAAMAKVEAEQFVNDDSVIATNLPKPGQWRVKVAVIRATVTAGKAATDPTEMKIEAKVTGEPKDIARWVQEYNSLHNNRGLSRRQEAEEFQRKLKAAKEKAPKG